MADSPLTPAGEATLAELASRPNPELDALAEKTGLSKMEVVRQTVGLLSKDHRARLKASQA